MPIVAWTTKNPDFDNGTSPDETIAHWQLFDMDEAAVAHYTMLTGMPEVPKVVLGTVVEGKVRRDMPGATVEECFCDRVGLGVPDVSCGDCPTRDYKAAPQPPQPASTLVTFNTGRWYSEHGQRIAADFSKDGLMVLFRDVDRGIEGAFPRMLLTSALITEEDVMRVYDAAGSEYAYWAHANDYPAEMLRLKKEALKVPAARNERED